MMKREWKKKCIEILFRDLNQRFVDWFMAFLLFGSLFILYTGVIAKYTSRPYAGAGASWKYCKMCGTEHYCDPSQTVIRPELHPDARPQVIVEDDTWRLFGRGIYDLFGKYFDADWWRHDSKERSVWHTPPVIEKSDQQ